LLDVIRVVEPIRRIHACPLELPEHADALCPLHQRLDDAMASIERSFSSTTIADLLTDGTPASEHFPALGPHACNGACRAAAARTDARDESAPHEELS